MVFPVKLFIKDHENVNDSKVREQYSVLSGVTGIIFNIILFFVKLLVGAATNSVAIYADAFNNLSDCGSSVISIAGAKLSNRHPDREHPFGHGRIEYIASLVVSFLILLVGFELLKTSFDKVLHPENTVMSAVLLIILCLTVVAKLFLFIFNRQIADKISSPVIRATAQDSLNDSIATSAAIIAAIIGQFTSFPVDGVMGILVSLFIMYGGFSLAKDTVGILLGRPASHETIKEISDILLSKPEILGIHDLIIHDYGPGRVMASVHAEVSEKENVIAAHEIIDEIEVKIMTELGIHMVIHMDPISTDNEIVFALRTHLQEFLDKTDKNLSFHDLRITDGENNINVIFDIVVPADYRQNQISEIKTLITNEIKSLNSKYSVVINVDRAY